MATDAPRTYLECDGLRGVSDMTEAWQLVHENERLRDEVARLRLTHAEREVIAALAATLSEGDLSWFFKEDVAALLGLLERHCPVSENPPSQDNKPDTHTKPDEGSVQDGVT